MAEKKFIIEVRTKGFARANRNFKQLNTDGKKYVETTKRMRRSTAGLEASLGSLRNRLLVNAFAIAAVTKGFQLFFRTAVQFEDVKTRLVGLTGSVENAEFAFQKFNAVAASTPFQLQDVVNAGAQLQAFGSVATETIQPITDLAAFMGTTATEAANAFGRAYAGGAGAADILREKGVLNIIKSFKGIEDLSKITLPEFRDALIDALESPSVGIAGSADRMSKTFTGAVSNMFDALGRLSATLADPLLPALTNAINKVTDFSKAARRVTMDIFNIVDPATISNFDMFGKKTSIVQRELSMMTVKHLPTLKEMLKKAEEESTRFQKSLDDQANAAQRSGDIFSGEYTLAIDNGSQTQENFFNKLKDGTLTIKEQTEEHANLTGSFLKIGEVVEEQTNIQETTNNTTNRATELVKLYTERIKELELAQKNQTIATAEANAEEMRRETLIKAQAELQKMLAEEEKKKQSAAEFFNEDDERRRTNLAAQKELNDLLADSEKERLDILSSFNSIFSQTDEAQRRNIESTIALMEANKELIISQNGISEADFDLAIGSLNENLSTTKDKAVVAASAITTLASGLKQMTAEGMSQEQKFASLLRTLAGLASLVPGGQLIGAGLTGLSMLVGHTGGLIGNNSIQRFATGGMVQGRDNVPIMAQAGEFIMQRSAVQNIGVQNLADMNRTGSAGGAVTVNISAPLVDDTVVESILPAIEKARRMNLA
jgi:3D (Asp-Asp-Asp) domain-containing protein